MKILIMAGGGGTRLWPKSTKRQPKQFQKLINKKTLFQMAIKRLRPEFRLSDIFVATNKAYVNLIKKQAPGLPKRNIISEPAKRDTASCIALASVKIAKINLDTILAVLPSDHIIEKEKKFLGVLSQAEKFLKNYPDYLVTLGIKPSYPSTGYGYIKVKSQKSKVKSQKIYKVDSFEEKPDLAKAKRYIKSNKYFWNSGMFVWKIQTILGEFRKYLPDIYKRLLKIQKSLGTKKEKQVIQREYPKMKKTSVDFAILEKAKKVAMIPVDLGWSDIGDWKILADLLCKGKKNLVFGQHLGIDTSGCLIYGPKDKLIATLGLKDMIIIVSDKAVLVCPKNQAQEVKKIVERLEKEKKEKYL